VYSGESNVNKATCYTVAFCCMSLIRKCLSLEVQQFPSTTFEHILILGICILLRV
jgi:hypothetical protein